MSKVLFWPDLATPHYAKSVTEYMTRVGLEFVDRKSNPPNVPQSRGIEKFWSECKKEYQKRKNKAKNLRSFRQIWTNLSRKVAKRCGKAIMDKSLKNLRAIGRKGVRGANVI